MFKYFAGPIELELSLEARIILSLFLLILYTVVVLVSSWVAAVFIGFYFGRFGPDTKLGKSLKAAGGVKRFTRYLFITAFISTIILLQIAWPYFDTLGDVGVGLFAFTIIAVPLGVSIVWLNARSGK